MIEDSRVTNRKMLNTLGAVAATLLATSASVPAQARDQDNAQNMLTHGMVQMTLHIGSTTQEEVLETFGAPNITTIDGQGQEVWVYDRQATVSNAGSSGFSIGMLLGGAGGAIGGGSGLGFGSSKSNSSSTQRTMTLIIKFGDDKKVIDFKSRSSSF